MPRSNLRIARLIAPLLAATALVLAADAPSAFAWRHPTASEWSQVRNVIHSYHRCCGGTRLAIHVGHVRISTIGPWAAAEAWVTLPNGLPDSVLFALHRYRGAWHVIDVGSAFVACSMPKPVRLDLGFRERCPPVGVTG